MASGSKYTVEINSPAEVVFGYLTDPVKLKQWLGGLKETKPLTDGEIGVGTRFHDVYDEGGGRTMEMTNEIVAYEPRRRIKIKGTNAVLDLTADYRLQESGGRTRLEFVSTYEFKKLLFKLMAPLVNRAGQKKLQDDFARLKRLAEAEQ